MSSSMTSLDRKLRASAFVRRNSGKVASELPHNELAQFLHESEEKKAATEDGESVHNSTFPTQCFKSDSPESWEARELFEEGQKLMRTWRKFQMKHVGFQDLDAEGPPSIQDLQSIMRTTVQDWDSRCDSKLSKAKKNFLAFSGTLVQFSDLFSIIPDGDKYTSLLTGVISTTVKAAGRRTEIAEGFSSALAEIGRALCLATAILNVHQTSYVIKQLVVLLYIRYSNFFCHFMTWHLGSSWDRIKTTLRNEYYTSEVRPHVREISKICERIESQARLISQHQLQITSERVQKLGIRFEIVLEQAMSDQRVMADDVDKRLQELKELIIGQCSHNNVAAMAEQQMYDADLANAAVQRIPMHTQAAGHSQTQHSNGPGIIEQPGASSSPVSTDTHTRDALERASLELLQYLPVTDTGMESSDNSHPATHLIPGMMVVKLGDWAGSPRSEMLWIIGAAFSNVNYANLAASHINNMAKVAGIPCISVFCTPNAKFTEPVAQKQSREMNVFIAILYILIHRLITFATETLIDVHELRIIISSLNGQKETISMALQAIGFLLRYRSPLLFIILDGLDQVETNETEPYLRELIGMIYGNMTPSSRLKVLLGSEGYLRSGSDLKTEECLDCAFLPSPRPGQALADGRFVNEIDGDVFPTSN